MIKHGPSFESVYFKLLLTRTREQKNILLTINSIKGLKAQVKKLEYYLVSNYNQKRRYLEGKYSPTRRDKCLFYKGNCLDWSTITKGRLILSMNNCEVFRKLPFDLFFVSQLHDNWVGPVIVSIDRGFIRKEDIGSLNFFLKKHNYRSDLLLDDWNKAKKSIKETVKVKNSISRRYLLRYHYLVGNIDLETFKKHKGKTCKMMREDPRLLEV